MDLDSLDDENGVYPLDQPAPSLEHRPRVPLSNEPVNFSGNCGLEQVSTRAYIQPPSTAKALTEPDCQA